MNKLIDLEDNGINPSFIPTVLIFISLGMILCSFSFIYSEIQSAKTNCESLDGEYKLVYSNLNFTHTCNGEIFYKYSDGSWDYSRNITFNEYVKNKINSTQVKNILENYSDNYLQ